MWIDKERTECRTECREQMNEKRKERTTRAPTDLNVWGERAGIRLTNCKSFTCVWCHEPEYSTAPANPFLFLSLGALCDRALVICENGRWQSGAPIHTLNYFIFMIQSNGSLSFPARDGMGHAPTFIHHCVITFRRRTNPVN